MATTWRVRADCTYSSSTNCNNARNAVNTLLAGYSYTPVAGRFTAGVTQPTSTRLTISVDLPTQADAVSMLGKVATAVNGTTKYSSGMTSLHRADV